VDKLQLLHVLPPPKSKVEPSFPKSAKDDTDISEIGLSDDADKQRPLGMYLHHVISITPVVRHVPRSRSR
jgi:hypothetical protein